MQYTVKPLLKGNWMEGNPVFSGTLSESRGSLTSRTFIKRNLPQNEKNPEVPLSFQILNLFLTETHYFVIKITGPRNI